MNPRWWEKPTCYLCDYWWLLLLIAAVGTAAAVFLPDVLNKPKLGTGEIQFTLRWKNTNDLDLWVQDPSGFLIFYGDPFSGTGGELDVDANRDCEPARLTNRPVENIFWDFDEAPSGKYVVSVNYYRVCDYNKLPTEFHLTVIENGVKTEYSGMVTSESETVEVTLLQH